MKELQAIVAALLANDAPDTVLATLVSVEGSSYRRPGARLLVRRDGTRIGSISGGCLEEDVLARAQRVFATGTAEAIVYDTTSENDLVWGVGLGCHGIVRVLIERLPRRPGWAGEVAAAFAARTVTELSVAHEAAAAGGLGTFPGRVATAGPGVFVQTITPPPALFIFGAGDDAQPVARFAHELGWSVSVGDPRPAFATRERFPQATRVFHAPATELVGLADPGADALAVVMTHHYVHDVPLLAALLRRPLTYLGLLGPRKRAERILEDLARDGVSVTPEQRTRLHAPVGLDLGADGADQVALAMIAEMHATLTGRSAEPLRDRRKPIHD